MKKDMVIKSSSEPTGSKESENAGAGNPFAEYEKPRILFRQKLEAAAAVCTPGEIPGTGGKEDTLTCEYAGS
jgi:hypothetical protein